MKYGFPLLIVQSLQVILHGCKVQFRPRKQGGLDKFSAPVWVDFCRDKRKLILTFLKGLYDMKTIAMTPAARTVCYFGFYLYVVSVTLVFFPNLLLRILGIPETTEVWIRIVGVLVGLIGYYYHRNGAADNRLFFPLTVQARILVFLSFMVFVLLKMASPMLIGFGVIDLLGALWTWTALGRERTATPLR